VGGVRQRVPDDRSCAIHLIGMDPGFSIDVVSVAAASPTLLSFSVSIALFLITHTAPLAVRVDEQAPHASELRSFRLLPKHNLWPMRECRPADRVPAPMSLDASPGR